MGNHGKMAGNSKICIGIQSQLILSEFIYLILFCFEKSNLGVQRNNTLNLECKEVRDQFWENFNFPYIFCSFDSVELQKMYGKKIVVTR